MFLNIDPSEFLLTAIVAVVVIGPKDLPRAMRTAGKWMGQMRRISGHFRSGIETMIREAELEEMEKKWREQNEAIMQASPPVAALPAEVTAVAPSEPLAGHEHGTTAPALSHEAAHHEVTGEATPAPGEPAHPASAAGEEHRPATPSMAVNPEILS